MFTSIRALMRRWSEGLNDTSLRVQHPNEATTMRLTHIHSPSPWVFKNKWTQTVAGIVLVPMPKTHFFFFVSFSELTLQQEWIFHFLCLAVFLSWNTNYAWFWVEIHRRGNCVRHLEKTQEQIFSLSPTLRCTRFHLFLLRYIYCYCFSTILSGHNGTRAEHNER